MNRDPIVLCALVGRCHQFIDAATPVECSAKSARTLAKRRATLRRVMRAADTADVNIRGWLSEQIQNATAIYDSVVGQFGADYIDSAVCKAGVDALRDCLTFVEWAEGWL